MSDVSESPSVSCTELIKKVAGKSEERKLTVCKDVMTQLKCDSLDAGGYICAESESVILDKIRKGLNADRADDNSDDRSGQVFLSVGGGGGGAFANMIIHSTTINGAGVPVYNEGVGSAFLGGAHFFIGASVGLPADHSLRLTASVAGGSGSILNGDDPVAFYGRRGKGAPVERYTAESVTQAVWTVDLSHGVQVAPKWTLLYGVSYRHVNGGVSGDGFGLPFKGNQLGGNFSIDWEWERLGAVSAHLELSARAAGGLDTCDRNIAFKTCQTFGLDVLVNARLEFTL